MNPRRLLPLLLLLLTVSCERDIPSVEPVRGDELVVEGWIDAGGHPFVSVTTTLLSPDEPEEVEGLMALMVRDAEVYVSDGTRTVRLTGGLSADFFPPYLYTTDEITGEVGKTYTLTVIHDGTTAVAETTIPEKTGLDSLEVFLTEDGVYRIFAGFTPDPGKCYGFFSRGSEDLFGYLPVFLGFINGADVSGPQTVSVTRGSGMTSIKEYKTGYDPGETVLIRFCTMDKGMYDFWNTFQQLTGVSFFLTFPSTFDNLPSNMTGAYGYWAGYGTAAYELTIPGSV